MAKQWRPWLAAMAITAGCGGTGSPDGFDGELRHGSIDIELHRGDNVDANVDVFASTELIRISFRYDQCLADFYAMRSEWAQDGREGEGVFGRAGEGEGWADRLCADRSTVECDVVSIDQDLRSQTLQVDYEVSGPLEGRVLAFGPLPGESLAACASDLVPSMSLNEVTGHVQPYMTTDPLWLRQSAQPENGYADQGAEIVVRVAPPPD